MVKATIQYCFILILFTFLILGSSCDDSSDGFDPEVSDSIQTAFDNADQNQDGILSREEFLEMFDINIDEQISFEEFLQFHEDNSSTEFTQEDAERLEILFDQLDVNENGVLILDEIFTVMDKNSDDLLTSNEIKIDHLSSTGY